MHSICNEAEHLFVYYSEDGKTTLLDLHDKWSTTILKELMTIAGGDPWKKYVAESMTAGLPPVIGEGTQHKMMKNEVERKGKDTGPLPSLKEFRARNPPTEKPNTVNASISESSTPSTTPTPT